MADQQAVATRIPTVMEDPRAEAIADVYANSLLDAAGGEAVGVLEEANSFVNDVLAANPDFKTLLLTDVISRDDKLAIIDRVVAPRGTPRFTNFLRVLARHDRLSLLPSILRRADLEHEQRSGRQRVSVRSAEPLSAAALERVRKELAASLPFDPIIETEVDPALIGGLVIRVGDTVYDSSLQARLKQMRAGLRARSSHEVQSGRDRFSHPAGD